MRCITCCFKATLCHRGHLSVTAEMFPGRLLHGQCPSHPGSWSLEELIQAQVEGSPLGLWPGKIEMVLRLEDVGGGEVDQRRDWMCGHCCAVHLLSLLPPIGQAETGQISWCGQTPWHWEAFPRDKRRPRGIGRLSLGADRALLPPQPLCSTCCFPEQRSCR